MGLPGGLAGLTSACRPTRRGPALRLVTCVSDDAAEYRSGARREEASASLPCDESLGVPALPLSPPRALSGSIVLEWRASPEQRRARASEALECVRRVAALRAGAELAIGRGLESLLKRHDLGVLGHSHLEDACRERFGFSAAHGRELRHVARRLAELPALSDAFLSGLLSRKRLVAVLRVATPEDAGGWAQLARRLTTRELEQHVAQVAAGRRRAPRATDEGVATTSEDGTDDAANVFTRWRGTLQDRVVFERHGLEMARTVTGRKGPTHLLAEAIAADALTTLGQAPPDPSDTEAIDRTLAGRVPRARRRRLSPRGTSRARARTRAPSPVRLARLARRLERSIARLGEEPVLVEPRWSEIDDPWEVVGSLQRLVRLREALTWERAQLLATIERRAWHFVLGFRSFAELAERALGLGPRTWSGALELSRRLEFLPKLSAAWAAGDVGERATTQLARVVEPETEDEWLAFADQVSAKLLTLSVGRALEDEARRLVAPGDGPQAFAASRPPWELAPRELQADWIDLLASREQRASHRKRLRAAGVAIEEEPVDDPLLDKAAIAGGRVGDLARERIGFAAPPDVAAAWWAAIDAVREAALAEGRLPLTDAQAVRVLLHLFARAHLTPEVERHLRRHRVLLRDGYRCTAPGCTAVADFHEHHVQFRSAGGPDDAWNLTSLCRGCHRLVHEELLRVDGCAPDDLTWRRGIDDAGAARETIRGERLVRAPALAGVPA